MKNSQRKAMFAVIAKNRKQTRNLNVYSPPPESFNTFSSKVEAQRSLNEQKKHYNSVRLVPMRNRC